MRKHLNFKYDLFECTPKPHWGADVAKVWNYLIHDDHQGHIESDEWYCTLGEAESACIKHIDGMCDGDSEPDYGAPTFQETYEKAWEQDQILKGGR